MNLIENLNWRYATKKMNGSAVPDEKVEYILESARLAPSSSGLQPYKIIVISDKLLLEKLKPFAHNQSQITDCSHLLVFAAWDHYSYERIENVFKRSAHERGLPADAMEAYQKTLWSSYEPLGVTWQKAHAARQAYIALGLALVAAAEQKVDSTPMEGFDSEKFDELLGLQELGVTSVTLLALGYRDEQNDWLLKLKKVRTPKEEFALEVKENVEIVL
jgi:nitroreductase